MEIPDNIYTLIAKKLDGEASPEDSSSLEHWLNTDPHNRETFHQLEKIHNETSQYLQQPVNTAKAWKNIQSKIGVFDEVVPIHSTRYRSLRNIFAIAASLILVIVAAWYGRTLIFGNSWEKVLAGKANMDKTLPDGSVVWLRKGAVLEWKTNFTEDRSVKLSGEAYFDVKHDENNRFSVRTGQSVTTVMGTAFIIRSQGGLDQVIVTRGKVKVASVINNKPTATLMPGDKLVLSRDKLLRSSVSDSNFLAWKTGLLVFKEMNLEKVLKVLSDFYQVPVSVKSKNLAENVSITVSFDHDPLEKALEEISLITGLAVTKQSDGSYLYSKK